MDFQILLKKKLIDILNFLISEKKIKSFEPSNSHFNVEIQNNKKFGDVSTNIAMVYSKTCEISPSTLGNFIVEELKKDLIIRNIQLVTPGFINIFFKNSFWYDQIINFLEKGFNNPYSVISKKYCVEFVSANPTGLMHIGHARGAVLGDSICSLLQEIGHNVTREFYINDAGEQISKLHKTIDFHLNKKPNKNLTDDLYPGEYLKNLSKKLSTSKLIDKEKITNIILDDIKKDLNLLKINHDNFVSEKRNSTNAEITDFIDRLSKQNLIYYGFQDRPKNADLSWKPKKQLLFRSKKFGDDSDRALKKPNGNPTYFLSDLIYHQTKINRNFDVLINIWGVDHSGYVLRLKNALKSINLNKNYSLDIKLTALVNLLDGKQPVKMSKRSGNYVTLRQVLDKVGSDALRFMMISRSPDKKIDFDFQVVQEKSKENPVFYIQYAHARCCSLIRNSSKIIKKPTNFKNINLDKLELEEEKSLIISICNFYNVLYTAATNLEPHKLANYLLELSKNFHFYWGLGKTDEEKKIFNEKKPDLSLSRLILVYAVSIILKKGLKILKINCPESM